jgi:hypothetical protein
MCPLHLVKDYERCAGRMVEDGAVSVISTMKVDMPAVMSPRQRA